MVTANTENTNGSSQLFSGAGPGESYVATSKSEQYSGSDRSGLYDIDGYTIEFQFDSGRTSRELYFRRGDDIFIGNRMYYAR